MAFTPTRPTCIENADPLASCDECGRRCGRKYWILFDHTACSKKCIEALVARDREEEFRRHGEEQVRRAQEFDFFSEVL